MFSEGNFYVWRKDLIEYAEGGSRTRMRLPSPVFETGASANSATSAYHNIVHCFISKFFIFLITPKYYGNNQFLNFSLFGRRIVPLTLVFKKNQRNFLNHSISFHLCQLTISGLDDNIYQLIL